MNDRYVWSGVVYSQGILQLDIVVLLTTSVQEARRPRREVPTQFDDQEVHERIWKRFQEELLWEVFTRLTTIPEQIHMNLKDSSSNYCERH